MSLHSKNFRQLTFCKGVLLVMDYYIGTPNVENPAVLLPPYTACNVRSWDTKLFISTIDSYYAIAAVTKAFLKFLINSSEAFCGNHEVHKHD